MACGCDTGGEVHLLPDVSLVAQARLSGVQADTQVDRAGSERTRHLGSSRECSWSGWEGEEERVSLRIDLDPAVRRAGRTHHPPVLGERLVVCLVPDLLEELRRSLHVGEEEGDGAGRKVVSHAA